MVYSKILHSPVGKLKISCTDDVITEVVFTDDGLEPGSEDEHPLLQRCSQQLEEYFAGNRKIFELPLGQTGTEFQQKTWNLLAALPYGKTVSYATLAQQYGDPKAIRALASANGKNNLAIIIPCHRVIGSNHTLVGYAGGLWRKKWLLEHEAKFHQGIQQMNLAGFE